MLYQEYILLVILTINNTVLHIIYVHCHVCWFVEAWFTLQTNLVIGNLLFYNTTSTGRSSCAAKWLHKNF